MFTQSEVTEINNFLISVKGYSTPYIRMRSIEFVRAMGLVRNTNKNFIIDFDKWLNMKFCKNNNPPDYDDWGSLRESIFLVLA